MKRTAKRLCSQDYCREQHGKGRKKGITRRLRGSDVLMMVMFIIIIAFQNMLNEKKIAGE
jgi:hypothetical protein